MVLTFKKRSASPLNFEPVASHPEDVVWPGSDDGLSEEHRAKKRQRVEDLGRQYLEGRPIFIQTASLRGPLDKGWKNPWVSKKNGYSVDDVRRFPQTSSERANQGSGVHSHTSGRPESVKRKSKLEHANEYGDSTVREDEERQGAGDVRLGSPLNGWLKKNVYFDVRSRDGPSPTPTPAARQPSRSLVAAPLVHKPQPMVTPQRPVVDTLKQPALDQDHRRAFTPIDDYAGSKNAQSPLKDEYAISATPKRKKLAPAEDTKASLRKLSLPEGDNLTRLGFLQVKQLSQMAVKNAERENDRLQKSLLPKHTTMKDDLSVHAGKSSRLKPYISEFVVSAASNEPVGLNLKDHKPSPHAVPPSTNLPEFQYRYARGGSSSELSATAAEAPEQHHARSRVGSSSSLGSSSSGSNVSSGEPNASRARAKADALRRLTFTASGGARIVGTKTSSRLNSSSSKDKPQPLPLRSEEVEQADSPVKEDGRTSKASTKSSDLPRLTNGTHSGDSVNEPEAQIVPDAQVRLAQVPSGPSTNLLETDKQEPKLPELDEGDSYLNLSTQAAILKAQLSFQNDVLSPLRASPCNFKPEDKIPAGGKSEVIPKAGNDRTCHQAATHDNFSAEEPIISTQAMLDNISPFAITTIKKRPPPQLHNRNISPLSPIRRQSRVPPSPAYHAHSPSMSTSPSPSPSTRPSLSASPPKPSPPIPLSHPSNTSKQPLSSLPSFSILPNGTLTETNMYQHDGQQQVRHDFDDCDVSLPMDPLDADLGVPGNAQGGMGSWELDDAIGEAGNFLGEWDVEAEAKRVGGSRAVRGDNHSGRKSILMGGRGE